MNNSQAFPYPVARNIIRDVYGEVKQLFKFIISFKIGLL